MTEWRPVVGFEGLYEVSDEGQIRSLDRTVVRSDGRVQHRKGRVLRQFYYAPTKRYNVGLYRDSVGGKVHVHRIVAAAFLGPCPDRMEVCHNDGDPHNNRADNLRYGTRSDNIRDMIKHGVHFQASKTHCKRGHEFTPENTYVKPSDHGRSCRTCTNEKSRVFYARKKNRRIQEGAA